MAGALSSASIAFVGAGNMGQALIAGLRAHKVPAGRICVVEAKAEAVQAVRRRFGVAAASIEDVARTADVLVLAVKPQDMAPVLATVREVIRSRRAPPLVISIAAGLQVAALQRALGRAPVVRVVPNLPAKVGAGMSVLCAGRGVASAQRRLARAIFDCVGHTEELPERHFDAVTAVSGSGPAYVFLFLHLIGQAGARLGLPTAVAERLAVQTALGAVRLVQETQVPLETLIAQVASKRGTTEAALTVFASRKLARTVEDAVAAAARRSKELSWSLSKS
jgi:pyrroline-5-carboxylate reductase